MTDLITITNVRAELGEGPIWYEDTLYWVDIEGKAVHAYRPKDETHRAYPVGQMVGTVVPRASGGLVLALQNGFAFLDTGSGGLTPIADPEGHLPENRFNDGKCDPAGRFWAGTMSHAHHPLKGALYMLDIDHTVHKQYGPVSISNGLCWSMDNTTMYYIDSPTRNVLAFAYDLATGSIADPEVCIRFGEADGFPDGMAMDAVGNLWIARWGNWSVGCYDPANGRLLDTIDVPAEQVTACAFGGDNLKTLYITTAQENFTDQQRRDQPLAGRLFRIDIDIKGIPAFAYKG